MKISSFHTTKTTNMYVFVADTDMKSQITFISIAEKCTI